MTELQQKLLDMMAFFHELCKSKGLRYYLLGGTALGAARHGGFIPWDDDIDIGMPRADYEKLDELRKTEDFGKYCFEYPGEAKDFVYPYGKLYDTETTLIENTRFKTKRGIFIDIFPLDGVGNTKEEALENFKVIDKKLNLLSAKNCAWRKGRKLYKNLALTAIRCVPEFILSRKKLVAKVEELSKKNDFDNSVYAANLVGNWHEKEIVKKEWLGTPILFDFEGLKLCCPENTDAYLSGIYGDWRKLPPKEKQVSHHDYLLLDLHKSYLENKN